MKLVVIGQRNGVAQALLELARTRAGMQAKLLGRTQIDLSLTMTGVDSPLPVLADLTPDVIINTARATPKGGEFADGAGEEERLFAVNGEGPGRLARIADALGVPLIHLSEAEVFDGRGFRPYRAGDPVSPVGAYALSLVAGEAAVRGACRKHLILRGGWRLDALPSGSLAAWMSAAEGNLVVHARNDIRLSPTSVFDLADAILRVCERWRSDPGCGLGETLHVAGPTQASPMDVARAALTAAGERGLINNRRALEPPPLSGAAPLSVNRCLDSGRFIDVFGHAPRPWMEGLPLLLDRLVADRKPRSAA